MQSQNVKKSVAQRKDQAVLRILDANLNRCREGLRVLEDTARFVWGNRRFFERFRKERHGVDRMARRIYPDLVRSRDSGRDDGRTIPEGSRENVRSLVISNFKRCEESLRVLEEYSKLFSSLAGSEFKKVRYRIYDYEREVMKSDPHSSGDWN